MKGLKGGNAKTYTNKNNLKNSERMKEESNKNSTSLQTIELTPSQAVIEEYKSIIDLYFLNGYNGAKAVREHRPDITHGTAKVLFSTLSKKQEVKEYINKKRQQLRATTAIQGEQILKELLQYAYSDATDYIGLSIKEIKSLPAEVRRSLQNIKHRKREYRDKNNNLVTEEVIEVRLVDKLAAIDKINKHIGFYSEDNRQKANNINIQQVIQNATPEQTKALIMLLKGYNS